MQNLLPAIQSITWRVLKVVCNSVKLDHLGHCDVIEYRYLFVEIQFGVIQSIVQRVKLFSFFMFGCNCDKEKHKQTCKQIEHTGNFIATFCDNYGGKKHHL